MRKNIPLNIFLWLNIFIFLNISFISSLYSQEKKITTEFSQNGNLYENLNENSQTLAEFKENGVCIVVDYLGKDIYKVNYKELIGFVKAEYLFVNDEMIELVIAYEDKIKFEAIEKEKKRKEEMVQLITKSEEEKLRQEAIEFKRKNEEEQNKKLEDSIAKVRIKVNENQEALELKRKVEEQQKRKLEDSISKTRIKEKLDQEALELRRKGEQELNKRREDSIVRVREEEKQKLEIIELKRKRETELNKIREDSIIKIKEQEKKKEEEQPIKKQEETLSLAKEDSVFSASQEIVKENKISEKIEFRSVCHYDMNEFDQFYGIRTIRTSPYSLNKNLMVELYRQAQRINIFFNLSEDLGCASYIPGNRSNVKVTLENNTVVTFYHSWDIDCGDFSFKGNLSGSDMEKLKKSPIKSITLKGTEGSYDITSLDYKEFFMDKLKCIE